MEEMLAKEESIQECRNIINQRDGSLQKFIKLNGSLVKNPKEEQYGKMIQSAYDRATLFQEEKIAFSEKAAQLVRANFVTVSKTTDPSIARPADKAP